MELGHNEMAAGPVQHAKKNEFNPYQDNGGYVSAHCRSPYSICSTTLAVAGSNFAVAVADDRVSKGYSICTRKGSKITKLYVTCFSYNHDLSFPQNRQMRHLDEWYACRPIDSSQSTLDENQIVRGGHAQDPIN